MNINLDVKGYRICLTNRGGFMLKILKRPYIPVMGISSRCHDGHHVLYLEFDHIRKDMMVDYAKLVIEKARTPDIFVFESSKGEYSDGMETGNYHLICLGKFTIREICDIQSFVPIDANYGRAWMYSYYKSWVLRTSPKGKKGCPKFIGVIESPYKRRTISTGHKEILEKYYNVPKIKYPKEDGCNIVYTQRYMTAHA